MYSGRWNCKGQRIIYTSLSLSTAILETLAHLDKTDIPDDFVKMEIEVTSLSHATSTPGWPPFITFHRSITAAKADPNIHNYGRSELARLIPSVIVPEYNVMLNPASKFFDIL